MSQITPKKSGKQDVTSKKSSDAISDGKAEFPDSTSGNHKYRRATDAFNAVRGDGIWQKVASACRAVVEGDPGPCTDPFSSHGQDENSDHGLVSTQDRIDSTNSIVRNYQSLWTAMRPAFRQDRTQDLLYEVVTGLLLSTARRRTITSAMLANGLCEEFNSKYYAVARESKWDKIQIQNLVFLEGLKHLQPAQRPVLAMDNTSLAKPYSGDEEYNEWVAWGIDHTGPKWMVQLMRAIRVQHVALMIPDRATHHPWSISIRFEPVKTTKQAVREAKGIKLEKRKRARPGTTPPIDVRKPTPWSAFRERARNLKATVGAEVTSQSSGRLRGRPKKGLERGERVPKVAPLMDSGEAAILGIWSAMVEAGEAHRGLLLAADGSYCNGRIFRSLPEGVQVIARARRNCSLFAVPETPKRNQVYGKPLPSPEAFARDTKIADSTVTVHYGGALQTLRIKEMPHPVRWKGTGRIPIRVIVVQAVPYKLRKKRKGYNQRAYLFTTDLQTPTGELCQAYCDRWSIEDIHRGAKTDAGLGDPQVGTRSTERLFTALMAGYSMLSLAAYRTYGPTRTGDYRPRPKWVRCIDERHQRENEVMGIPTPPRRPSAADILQRFRDEWRMFQAIEPSSLLKLPRDKDLNNRLA